MESWQVFDDPRFTLQFKYPSMAANGEPVERVETQFEGVLRVHVLSPTSCEIYFEVSKYEALSAEGEYVHHKADLLRQFHPLTISEMKPVICASLPAYEYTFGWDQGERTVILLERGGATYRILYNPRFPVNLQILSTMEWLKLP